MRPTAKRREPASTRTTGAAADSVYDPFLGSGDASKKLNRACYGMEIEPRYVDVIRRRWAEFVEGAGCVWEAATPATS